MKHKSDSDVYTEYYMNQAGSGFGNVYASGVYQKGQGIGSFLGGLFRCVFPLLKSGSSAIGSEILKSGANIISDISRSESPNVALKKRGKEAINNLSSLMGEKMFGRGYMPTVTRKRPQSSIDSRSGKKSKSTNKKSKSKAKVKSKSIKKTQQKRQPKSKTRGKKEIFDIFA